MRGAAAALAALAALVLLLVAPAASAAASREELQAAAFDVSTPAAPLRDVVIERPTRSLVRATASASSGRYPVNDGQGRTVQIDVTDACQLNPASCNAANPQDVANFLGSVPHGDEMNLLVVTLVEPSVEMALICGSAAAQACYFPAHNMMVISGNNATASDGATREFVVAHEYGHHLANHRDNAPFNPAIEWGPKHWASHEGVCQGERSGVYFPGDEGPHYFENPGEAFAEAYAFNRFPTAPVQWAWIASLQPDAGAFAAIQRDSLDPWTGRATEKRKGRFKSKRKRRIVKRFGTPLDGELTLKLAGPDRADMSLKLRSTDGRTLERSDGLGSHEKITFTICGERSVRVVVKRRGVPKTRFRLKALRP